MDGGPLRPPKFQSKQKGREEKKKAERKSPPSPPGGPLAERASGPQGAICWEGHQDADMLQPHTRQLRASTDWIEGGTRRPLLAAHPPRSHTPFKTSSVHSAAATSRQLDRDTGAKTRSGSEPPLRLLVAIYKFSLLFFHRLLSLIVGTSNGMMEEDEFRFSPPPTPHSKRSKPGVQNAKQQEGGKWVFWWKREDKSPLKTHVTFSRVNSRWSFWRHLRPSEGLA